MWHFAGKGNLWDTCDTWKSAFFDFFLKKCSPSASPQHPASGRAIESRGEADKLKTPNSTVFNQLIQLLQVFELERCRLLDRFCLYLYSTLFHCVFLVSDTWYICYLIHFRHRAVTSAQVEEVRVQSQQLRLQLQESLPVPNETL